MGVRPAKTAHRPRAAAGRSLGEGAPANGWPWPEPDGKGCARLRAAGAGAWVELLDGLDGASVLLAEHRPGGARARIAAEAAVLGLVDRQHTGDLDRHRRHPGRPARLLVGTELQLAGVGVPWDVVIVDGVLGRSTSDETAWLSSRLRRLAGGLGPAGRLVVVADNRLSPLRAADRAVGRPAGPAGPSLTSIERAVGGAGLVVHQRFALLRSSVDGVTAFDLDAPQAASAVLEAATVRNELLRTAALRVLRRLAQRQVAGLIVPAWMVVASPSSSPWAPSRPRPTGRLGHEASEESKVVRGEPPVELDKRCSTPDATAREVMALRALESCHLPIAPRLLARRGRTQLTQTWLPGHPLRPAGLGRTALRTWVGRSAATLASVQRATQRSDGTVLVHGDYWLGNLLVDGDEVVAVLDWTRAHWGRPTEDLDHLVDHVVRMGLASGREGRVLTELARAAHGRGMAGIGPSPGWPGR